MKLNITINELKKSWEISPNENLLMVLRREGFNGPKFGCGAGECGACTLLLDGKPVNSCVVMAAHCEGSDIITIEGIGNPDNLHPIQITFLDEGGAQCGYCTPGMIVSAYALLLENPDPSEEEIKEALAGNLCRCTAYVKPIVAIQKAAQLIRERKPKAVITK